MPKGKNTRPLPIESGFQTPEKRPQPKNYSPPRKPKNRMETPDISSIKVRAFNCFA